MVQSCTEVVTPMESSINMTYSCLLPRNDGKEGKIVRVSFERRESTNKSTTAEGILPDAVMEKNNGFSEDEMNMLQEYLKTNCDEIMKKAKEISGIIHYFGDFTK